MNFIHKNENGKVAVWGTFKYIVALLFPFWDGQSAPGRAYTPKEMATLWPKKNPVRNHAKNYGVLD